MQGEGMHFTSFHIMFVWLLLLLILDKQSCPSEVTLCFHSQALLFFAIIYHNFFLFKSIYLSYLCQNHFHILTYIYIYIFAHSDPLPPAHMVWSSEHFSLFPSPASALRLYSSGGFFGFLYVLSLSVYFLTLSSFLPHSFHCYQNTNSILGVLFRKKKKYLYIIQLIYAYRQIDRQIQSYRQTKVTKHNPQILALYCHSLMK